MLPFVLAVQLALSHGKVFISHQLQGGSQTKVKETFSSRHFSTDNINSQRAYAYAFSLSLSPPPPPSGNIRPGKSIEILIMKVTFMLIKVLLLILPGHIMALKFAYIFKCICFRLIEGGPLFLYVNIVQGFFFFWPFLVYLASLWFLKNEEM